MNHNYVIYTQFIMIHDRDYSGIYRCTMTSLQLINLNCIPYVTCPDIAQLDFIWLDIKMNARASSI